MDGPMSVEELTEELTIHRVMLESLEDCDHEQAEEDRVEARKEIEKLRRLLRFAKEETQTPGANGTYGMYMFTYCRWQHIL